MSDPFDSFFEARFGEAFPLSEWTSELVLRGPTFWTSLDDARLSPENLMMPEPPDVGAPYRVVGVWGYGLRNVHFNVIYRDERVRWFFMFPFGDPYAEAGKNQRELLAYLHGAAAWHRERPASVVEERIKHTLGYDKARLAIRGGGESREFLVDRKPDELTTEKQADLWTLVRDGVTDHRGETR